jgi:hypothetical protein
MIYLIYVSYFSPSDSDRPDNDREFKLLSTQKSFFLRADDVEIRNMWFNDILRTCE